MQEGNISQVSTVPYSFINKLYADLITVSSVEAITAHSTYKHLLAEFLTLILGYGIVSRVTAVTAVKNFRLSASNNVYRGGGGGEGDAVWNIFPLRQRALMD